MIFMPKAPVKGKFSKNFKKIKKNLVQIAFYNLQCIFRFTQQLTEYALQSQASSQNLLSTSFLGASRSYFSFSPLLSYPPWNFLIFYINYTKYIEMNSKLSLSLFSLSLEFQIPQVFKRNYVFQNVILRFKNHENHTLKQVFLYVHKYP